MSTVEKLPDFNNDDEDWDFNLDEVEVALLVQRSI